MSTIQPVVRTPGESKENWMVRVCFVTVSPGVRIEAKLSPLHHCMMIEDMLTGIET